MLQNNNFLFFFKIIFDISISKQFENTKKINFKKIKIKIIFFKNSFKIQKQTDTKIDN
jgi:hypothetical protein